MKIIKVLVDEIPLSCGECPLCVSGESGSFCACLPKEEITDKGKICNYIENPYSMYYRRSDCKLEKYNEQS